MWVAWAGIKGSQSYFYVSTNFLVHKFSVGTSFIEYFLSGRNKYLKFG
jgi:hypothetical protein